MLNRSKVTKKMVLDTLMKDGFRFWNWEIDDSDIFAHYGFCWSFITDRHSNYIENFLQHLEDTFSLARFWVFFIESKNSRDK